MISEPMRYANERNLRACLDGLTLTADASLKRVEGSPVSRWAFVLSRNDSIIMRQSGSAPRWVSGIVLMELWAVANGVWWMVSRRVGIGEPVNVLSDSQNAIRLLKSAPDPGRDAEAIMASAITDLAAAFDPVRYAWLPRRQNREADDLASLRPGRDTKKARKNQLRRAKVNKAVWADWRASHGNAVVVYRRGR